MRADSAHERRAAYTRGAWDQRFVDIGKGSTPKSDERRRIETALEIFEQEVSRRDSTI